MIVIADDITGAAEIAGIAYSQGQQVRLVCGGSLCCNTVAAYGTDGTNWADGTTVIATDTRSMTEADAIAETHRMAAAFGLPEGNTPFHLFKKTDSALRGHVVAELTALMEATGYQRAVYLPANPSKGRVIRNGIYYINDVPIHETAFSYDPEFPAKTSVLKERFPEAVSHQIMMPDAESGADIRRVIARYDDGHTLFAGAADLFTEWLESSLVPRPSSSIARRSSLAPRPSPLASHNTLVLCGSTQSKPLDLGIPVAAMPRAVYDGSHDLTLWDTSAYKETHSLILTMPYTHRTGKEAAVHLRTVMAQKTMVLVAQHRPDHLIIEGGATAWATLQALGWTQFQIVRQIAPGVVQMSATNDTLVTLKPGSYPWGNLF